MQQQAHAPDIVHVERYFSSWTWSYIPRAICVLWTAYVVWV